MHARVLLDMEVRPSFDPTDVARWTGGVWNLIPARPVGGVSIDTRTIGLGDIFVAIRGANSDGHRFIDQAMAKGAGAVMVEDAAALEGFSIPALVVPSTRRALMDFARGYRSTLSCRMIAVTGSVGKTTVKELIADMLHHVGITSRTLGNWNNDIGLPLSILAARPDTRFGVFEVGMNHPGELDPLCELLAPDVSVITCIGPVHIEHFENEEGIAREKAAVFRALSGTGTAIVNRDDPYASLLMEYAGTNRVIQVSHHDGADMVFRRVDPAHGRFDIIEKATGACIDCEAALPGAYFVQDAVLAAAVARALGIGWPVIRSAIHHYRPLSMRWNRDVCCGVHFINDAYNANPVSMQAALHALMEERVSGQRWLVLGGMLELGADEQAHHRGLGRVVAGLPGVKLVALGPRGSWIAEGALEAGMDTTRVFAASDATHAAEFLYEQLRPGDTVLLKGSRGEAVEAVLNQWTHLNNTRNGFDATEG